jgi:hypothetical protein
MIVKFFPNIPPARPVLCDLHGRTTEVYAGILRKDEKRERERERERQTKVTVKARTRIRRHDSLGRPFAWNKSVQKWKGSSFAVRGQ